MKFIQSMQNPQVKHWKKLTAKKEREKTYTYLLEGFHLVEEALKEKEGILEIIIEENVKIPESWDLEGVPVTTVTQEISKALADTETSQGIFAVCRMKKQPSKIIGKRYLLIDAVQDPGNIGTMIRTADAAGFDAVILGKGCADAYSPKVLRAAQGSHLHVGLLKGDLNMWIEKLKEAAVPVYGTALEGGVSYQQVTPGDSFAILVGNEGSGVNPDFLAQTEQNLYIPIFGKSESLNVAVAAGIIMYDFQMGTLKG
ncbi:TrmH family RNA methyltransferase [Heyndrickxia acidiproducens]|uniref:TrmH family RNA methyltransferase n=1 Tax=Heyndrickxia acidiproducens TaxID=1121084 RepID=UPI0003769C03|nr:RNA methyltransferase [Heyndrickxia acidiproducens]